MDMRFWNGLVVLERVQHRRKKMLLRTMCIKIAKPLLNRSLEQRARPHLWHMRSSDSVAELIERLQFHRAAGLELHFLCKIYRAHHRSASELVLSLASIRETVNPKPSIRKAFGKIIMLRVQQACRWMQRVIWWMHLTKKGRQSQRKKSQ